ncbi:OLC1v1019003C1 [Oldenlandia corymbosa var. corymbosa]|uniref:OLC1v1019003C1 n=1 Tax=Oldenlandia corymbosa var. corymbosa TaxID=529605 RepID=A0AAV1EDD2_OLDCO|nr:OLC1v1019003C1 [Oldenlandia corymbosa var. corymbosa]
MVRGGKLTKFKLHLKKLLQFFNHGRTPKLSSIVAATNNSKDDSIANSIAIRAGLHPVYVSQSRCRYLLPSEVTENPLFKELVDRFSNDCNQCITIGCGVVFFDHFLWMLENVDPLTEPLDDIVDLYALF